MTGKALGVEAYDLVKRELPTPVPQWNILNQWGFAFTQVPLWWWIDQAQWHAVSATSTVPGLSATATATPVEIVFDPGDGTGPHTCPGPGVVFNARLKFAEQSTPCVYVYHHSSALAPNGRSFISSMSVRWTVSWTATDGDGGPLGDLVSSTGPRPMEVAEQQIVLLPEQH